MLGESITQLDFRLEGFFEGLLAGERFAKAMAMVVGGEGGRRCDGWVEWSE